MVDTLRYPTGSGSLQLRFSGYSAFRRPGQVNVYAGSTFKEKWTYLYDSLGRITTIDTGKVHDYVRRQFTYDARGRLASYSDTLIYADSTQQPCPNNEITCDPPPEWDFSWNKVGIRGKTYSPDYSGNRVDGSASLSNDRLTSMTGANGVSYSFSYDDEGRLLSRTASADSQTYGWNDLGQLVWIKTNGDSIAYGYDAAGRRVRKWRSGTTTEYLWDGDQLLMELDGSGARLRQYTYQAGIDQPVSVKVSGTTYYLPAGRSRERRSGVEHEQFESGNLQVRSVWILARFARDAGAAAAVEGARVRRRDGPVLRARPVLRPEGGPVHQRRPDRARGWDQSVYVCGWGTGQQFRPEWSKVLQRHPVGLHDLEFPAHAVHEELWEGVCPR